jgi:hypothetical protein
MPNTKMPAARLGINNFQVGKYVLFARIENPDAYRCPKVRLKVLCISKPLADAKYFEAVFKLP